MDTLDFLELSGQMHGLTDQHTNPQLVQALHKQIAILRS